MTQATSHYTTVHNLRLHYLEAGEGPPVLLLHGFPTSSHLYRNILPELGKTHRAIALDLPGYGLSDKPLDVAYDYDFYADVISSFLAALGIEETNLVVHDLGGPIVPMGGKALTTVPAHEGSNIKRLIFCRENSYVLLTFDE